MADTIYYNDKADYTSDVVLTASSEATSYNVGYVQDVYQKTLWRTTGINTESILFDFGSATKIKAVGWMNSNVVSGDTSFVIKAGTTIACTDKSLNLTKKSNGVGKLDGDTGWNYRYFKIIVTKASESYIEFGKISLLADFYEFEKCQKWDYTTGHQSFFYTNVGEFGQIIRKYKYSNKIFDFIFEWVQHTQAEKFDEEIRKNPYIWIYSTDYANVYYGVQEMGVLKKVRDNYYSINLNFKEAK
jgi:hypothetical protein